MAKKTASKKTTRKTAKKTAKRSSRKAGGRGGSDAAAVADPDLSHPPPLAIEDILGQENAKDVLHSSLASGRVHHAWVFHGPRGVGKFTTALSFASLLLDPALGTDLAGKPIVDPATDVQRLLASGTHPDLHIIRKELARYSESSQVRDSKLTTIAKDVIDSRLIKPAGLRPAHPPGGAASKVFVVDEAELSNTASQNALLKTLEEPPEGTVIILVTSNEDRLLPTIRSRCQRVEFTSLDDNSMSRWAKAGLGDTDPEEARWLLSYAEGAPGVAVEAKDSKLYQWQLSLGPMLDAAWRGSGPVELGPTMAELSEAWAEAFVKQHAGASKANANKDGAANVFRLVGGTLRHRLSEAAAAGDPNGIERATSQMDAITRAESRLRSNVALKLVMAGLAEDLSAPASAFV